ncbi:MAG: hypothetical protein RL642_464 [Bacteroidota bacterium]
MSDLAIRELPYGAGRTFSKAYTGNNVRQQSSAQVRPITIDSPHENTKRKRY